jgi:hypothetical protein
MIPIEDKVDVAQLVDFNWRPTAHPCGYCLDARPPLQHAVAARQEGAGEIRITADTAHNCVQWNLLQATIRPAARPYLAQHLLVRE